MDSKRLAILKYLYLYLVSNVGIFKCETYFKIYKTKNGLIRHHNAKHVVTENYNIESTQRSTSTPIDEVKTVVNTLSQDNLTEHY